MLRCVSIVAIAAVLTTGCGGSRADPAATGGDQPEASGDFPTGSYRVTITSDDSSQVGVLGEWTLDFTEDGTWSLSGLSEAGRAMATTGDYSASRTELTILSDVVCGPGHAVFRWSFSGGALRLEPVREECQQIRTAHLSAKPWTKTG